MNVFITNLLNELESELKVIEQDNEYLLKRSELGFKAALKSVAALKEFIIAYNFNSEEEEIRFFKETKPLFTSKQIFNLMLYNIETKKPKGGNKVLRKYLCKELEKLKNYFDYNLDFYKYYRAGANYLDHKYFVRNKFDIQLTLDANIFENDPRFSTTHDFKIAKILAHDRLQVHIEDELAYLDRRDPGHFTQDVPKTKLSWTDSKTALIELIYALNSHGSLDNGRADIKDIAAYFEAVFNIELGDFYRTFLEIRMRKTGQTKFLSALQETLIKRMDQADEK